MTRIVSFSELNTLRQCRLKHHLAYEERWKMPETSPALVRGSLFHKAMETFSSALQASEGLDNATASMHQYLQAADAEEEIRDLVTWMCTGYVAHYQGNPDWEILGVEMPVEGPLHDRDGNETSITMKGKIDLLVRDHSMSGGVFVVDHKTTRNLPREKDYDFDDQSAIYTMLCKYKGIDVRGTIFDAVRTQKLKREMTPEERFARVITVRTDTELKTMEVEAYETFRDLLSTNEEGPSSSNEKDLPPRSPDPDRCGWRCSFTEACLMSRKGPDIRDLLSAVGGVQDHTRH